MRINAALPPLYLITLLPLGPAAFGDPINFTFKAVTAEVSFNRAPPAKVDLTVDLAGSTERLVKGGGFWGSDRYLDLRAFFSSRALGLARVEANSTFSVQIGLPAGDAKFRNSTVVLDAGNNVVSGVFNMRAIENWNRVSSIGPLLGPATASTPLNVTLKSGDTLTISTLESAQPYGNASFEAYLVPERVLSRSARPAVNGSMRKLRENGLYLQTGDKVQKFRLLAKTQFRDEQGAPIRDSLLHRGDQLSLLVNPDDPVTALTVILVHKRE